MHDATRGWVLRVGLAFLAAPAVLVGMWAALAPRGFYDDFPGLGQIWIAPDGPFNEHLVRDVGALNLALAIVTVGAIVTLAAPLVRWVLAAWVVEGLLHVLYHARHLAPFGTSDQVSIIGGLVLVPVLAVALLFVLHSRPAPAS
jgi:hypothetical protein